MELPTHAQLNEMWRNLRPEQLNEIWRSLRPEQLNDVWSALGFSQKRSSDREWLGRLSLFGAGLLVGAGVALLLSAEDESSDEEPEQAREHQRFSDKREPRPETPAEDLH